ncbi:XrtA/PEP-CTERM system TPR-repeat protein PrsT [Rheinheimera sp.]|uniref:XrtA/PEP-CTERM system TPR-repeat protein PrsT n=1 Tax=Rheinheimera sp. TaxID=1869214 RepID=UPI0027339512|nr:XrtA/PEP-CTERM system TPR-repeat protein PrsT [Rheinheimera sp.]MDP2715844.1 PEP-CTERM system TPR-repeat protein PrsT [Rheinheimera sp.]
MKKTTILAGAIALALLSGCGSKDATEHYGDALNYIETKQYNAAVIELKSAILQMPDNADYRLTLGKLYLQIGDAVSAEKELSRALSLGANAESLALPLVRAFYLSENYQKILSFADDHQALEAPTKNYIQLYTGLSEIELSGIDSAIGIFDSLLLAEQNDIKAFSEAMLSMHARRYDNAQVKLQQITADSPVYFEALLMDAHSTLILAQPEDALKKLHIYLEHMPNALKVRLLTAQTLVQQNELVAAEKHLQLLLKVVPEHGLTNYLQAVVEYDKKNYQTAKEHSDKAISAKLNTVQNRVLAGLINYQLGLEAQALNHLSAISQYLPQLPEVNRLYSVLKLKSGEASEAADSLADTKFTAQDLNLVTTTAMALLRAGNSSAAEELISKYEQQIVSEDADNLHTLGRLKLSITGQEAAGIASLEQALRLDPSHHHTRLILAGNYIRLRQFDKATQLADEWLKEDNTRAAGYNLKALVYLIQQDFDSGKTMLESAISADANNVFTHFMLAAVAQKEGETDKAEAYLLKAIDTQPDYQPALASYYASQNRKGTPDTAIALIEKSQKAYPDNLQLRLLLANIYQSNQRSGEVISLLEPLADTQQTLIPAFYSLMIDAYLTQRQEEPALNLAQRWFNDDNKSLKAALTYASLLSTANRSNESIRVVDNALKFHTNHPALLKVKMLTQADEKDYAGAMATYAQLPPESAGSAEMLFHKGRIQLLDGQLTPGRTTLLSSYNLTPSATTAIAIAEAYSKDVSYRKAVTFIEEHIEKHGENRALRTFYANLLMQDDISKALAIYQQLTSEQPDNIISLNNYAWLLLQTGKAEEALVYAERAVKLNARQPDILDTYGKILLALGKYSEAKQQFEQSLALRPKNAEVQLNYAELLIKTAQYGQAKSLLTTISSDNPELIARKNELQSHLQ